MKIAYVRVSTVEQNEQRQVVALEKHEIEKWYIEKVSGKDTNRPKLKEMLDFAREGDTIYIHDFSRLARSTKDLLDIVEQLNNKGIHLVSNKENIDSSTPTGKLIAKEQGKFKGGQVKKIDDTLFNSLLEQYNTRAINKKEFAEKLNVSRPTLD